ncbi:hypothetical protein GLAREA_12703 [Glarea lozoyensis ATCC 20868]|uniref:Uncharacterized protein n=1 Tax=Glarea lozoyensis (strain ATCC 20868 / MF5171) TaxID=1116229 RepID=S3D0M6_GLAL2|nr:uncharacterized protein GLAREA_12703 [Glarea lozoyensis ATCC 20868]EPE31400.1 hypothetical protein GLAREA_12703 [Glarea lozoyensis ATCC 20868]
MNLPLSTAEVDFEVQYLIMQAFSKACSTIATLSTDMDSWGLAQSLCRDLDRIRDDHQHCWTREMETTVLGSQLCLYMLQLEHESKKSPNIANRRKFLEIAYLTSGKLVHVFIERANPVSGVDLEEEIKPCPLRYGPKIEYSILLLTLAFLIKLKYDYANEIGLEKDEVSNRVEQICAVLSQWSLAEDDEPSLAIKVVDDFARAEKQNSLKIIQSEYDGRAGSSLLEDLIRTCLEIRSKEALARKNEATHHSTMQNFPSTDMTQMTPVSDLSPVAFEDLQDPLLGWDMPWGLDFGSTEPFGYQIME